MPGLMHVDVFLKADYATFKGLEREREREREEKSGKMVSWAWYSFDSEIFQFPVAVFVHQSSFLRVDFR